MNFILFFPTVFMLSGFNRTLCGSAWDSLSSTNDLSTTGRLGCCAAGKFMSKPQLDPFVASTACANCPAGKYSTSNNAYSSCTVCATGKTQEQSATPAVSCAFCVAGKQFDTSSTPCTNCGAGRFQDQANVASVTCKSCAAGKIQEQSLSTFLNNL